MTLEFLISTTDYTNRDFLSNTFKHVKSPDREILVINQSQEDNADKNDLFPNERILTFQERGISKSRNRGLDNAIGDICVIADNDLVYLPNSIDAIRQAYIEDKELDVAVFQIITPEGLPYKRYKSKPFRVTKSLEQMQISSVEITFRLQSIRKCNIRFNEKMGLGAQYTHGEELLFINDCIKKGLKIKYFPIPIVIHPKESSGKTYSKSNVIASGITFLKLFPLTFLLFDLYFALKRFPKYKQTLSFFQYMAYLIKGNWLALTGKI